MKVSTNWPKSLPEPGIYPNVPDDEYRRWPAVSQSLLNVARGYSWGHAKAVMDGEWERPATDAMRFGRAVHCWLLEPEAFCDRFKVAEPCSAILKTGDRKGLPCGATAEHLWFDQGRHVDAWLCGVHSKGRAVQRVDNGVTDAEMTQILGMESRLCDHPAINLLRHPGEQEVSVCCELHGVPVKGRLDRWCPPIGGACGIIKDLKKMGVGDGASFNLRRKIRDYGYDVQAAMYTSMIQQVIGDSPAYCWVFIEDKPPHMVAARRASSKLLELGYRKLITLLSEYQEAQITGYWPGYGDELEDIEPEQFELREHFGNARGDF